MAVVQQQPFQHFCNVHHEQLSTYESLVGTILPQSSQDFLSSLNLASVHPFCTTDDYYYRGTSSTTELWHNNTSPLWVNQNDTTFSGNITTGYKWALGVEGEEEDVENIRMQFLWMITPSLMGLLELISRLVASLIVPIFLLYSVWKIILDSSTRRKKFLNQKIENETYAHDTTTSKKNIGAASTITKNRISIRCTIFLLMAIGLVVTDIMCIQEIETFCSLFLACCALFLSVLRLCFIHYEFHPKNSLVKYSFLCFAMVAVFSFWYSLHEQKNTSSINGGLYHSSSNDRVQKIIGHWPSFKRSYGSPPSAISSSMNMNNKNDAVVPTPWMLTGDWRTVFPFLLNSVPRPPISRVWFEVDDGEVVAFDISFPASGYNSSKPVYFVLHGLNGGSGDEYIKDLTWRSIEEGSTVVAMVARGYMDLPLRGLDGFHAARWQDALMAAKTIRAALGKGQRLIGVGYSMGGIILNNMIAQSGEECPLDAAISISSALDVRLASEYPRAWRMWHSFLAAKFRHSIILNRMGYGRLRQRLTSEQIQQMMSIKDVLDLDEKIMAPYHGFQDRDHYYSEASVLGDMTNYDLQQPEAASSHRVSNISIPLCVVHAMDDPILSWRGVASDQGFMHPKNLVKSGRGNLMLLLTKRGGHVGWPVGIKPQSRKWQWMSDLVLSFGDAVLQSSA